MRTTIKQLFATYNSTIVISAAMSLGICIQARADLTIPEPPDFSVDNAAVYGQQLMEYADAFDTGWRDEVLKGQMTLIDAAGRQVERSFVRLSMDRSPEGNKVIIRFTKPNDIRGVSALTFENRGASDDNWLYLPSTKRVRRISGANNTSSFQGTEFTYEDLSSIDPKEYEFNYLEEVPIPVDGASRVVHKIGAVPTYADTGYSRLVVYLDPESWVQVKTEFYDLSGTLLKTRESSSLKQFHDRFWRAGLVDMTNHQTGKRTTLTMDGYTVDLSLSKDRQTGAARKNLTESQFTTRAIAR